KREPNKRSKANGRHSAHLSEEDAMSNIGSLHVRGRRTGVMRIVRLRYAITPDGSVLISAGGLSEQWPLNLRANPACPVELRAEVRHYHAIERSVRRFPLHPV